MIVRHIFKGIHHIFIIMIKTIANIVVENRNNDET